MKISEAYTYTNATQNESRIPQEIDDFHSDSKISLILKVKSFLSFQNHNNNTKSDTYLQSIYSVLYCLDIFIRRVTNY